MKYIQLFEIIKDLGLGCQRRTLKSLADKDVIERIFSRPMLINVPNTDSHEQQCRDRRPAGVSGPGQTPGPSGAPIFQSVITNRTTNLLSEGPCCSLWSLPVSGAELTSGAEKRYSLPPRRHKQYLLLCLVGATCCGTASAGIGLLYPFIDRRLGEPHKFKREWSSVMRCVAVFVGINHASAKVDFANNVQLSLTLAALSIGLWWTFDRSRSGFGLGSVSPCWLRWPHKSWFIMESFSILLQTSCIFAPGYRASSSRGDNHGKHRAAASLAREITDLLMGSHQSQSASYSTSVSTLLSSERELGWSVLIQHTAQAADKDKYTKAVCFEHVCQSNKEASACGTMFPWQPAVPTELIGTGFFNAFSYDGHVYRHQSGLCVRGNNGVVTHGGLCSVGRLKDSEPVGIQQAEAGSRTMSTH
ncbi:hypothetical protein F7725_001531 [Dissostichus mawsoni]|uniref:Insulin-induced gene 2 protein n=1 Tax=Dissostichus mawsoni TaxID=36200 RepID=A0A7J5XZX4_DISMA|nr:hypothetical protein F7725_001531 [Dissostichus mawsoni]